MPVVDAEGGIEEAAASTPMEVDKEKAEDSKNQTPVPSNQPTPQQQTQQQSGQGQGPPQPPSKDVAPQIDLLLEASKLPLDVAIFNSARAAGGDDKIRKYLQAVLVVGGTGLTSGIGHALRSRYAFVHSFTKFTVGGRRPPLLELRDNVLSFHSSLLLGGGFCFHWIFPGMVLMIAGVGHGFWQVAGDCYSSGTKHGKGSDHSASERCRPASSYLEGCVRVGTYGGCNRHVGDRR